MIPISNDDRISRRNMLRGAGVALALPWLDWFAPRLRADEKKTSPPRRMICLCTPLGLHAANFFPTTAGRDYEITPYLEPLKEYRNDFTVISGLSHPDVGSTHDSQYSFLTGALHPENRGGFRNSISLDQLAAEHLGDFTRFRTLALSAEGFGLSWTRSGALVPSDVSPSTVFARLFLEGRPDEVESQARRLRDGRSILDQVLGHTKRLRADLGVRDREKLDEYFTSVRELERQLAVAEEWSKRPKPKVEARPPEDNHNPSDLVGKNRLMFDLMHLAVQTDSTRLITYCMLGTSLVPPIAGVSLGHHDLSHHGQDPNKIAQLRAVELEKMKTIAEFLGKLKRTDEQGANLLDRTIVYFSSNLGNASNHSSKNLPVLLAGGGFRHVGNLPFDPDKSPPLCNLYVSMLQRLGLEINEFGTSNGTLTGLESTAG